MEYYLSYNHYDSYSGHTHTSFQKCKRAAYFECLAALTQEHTGIVSTRVKRRWFRSALHVMVLDCDSLAQMGAAALYLQTINLKYETIESSPGRYWFIVDYCDTLQNVLTAITHVPGIDRQWWSLAYQRKLLTLRGAADPGRFPAFSTAPPQLSHPLALRFYLAFKALYDDPRMFKLYRARCLQQSVDKGTMVQAMADPNFKI